MEDCEEFKPVFLGFTGGIRKGESMAEFIKRVNSEGGSIQGAEVRWQAK